MTATRKRTVLLTGATGLLGHYLLAELCRRTEASCRVLLRPPIDLSRRRLRNLLAELGINLDAHVLAGRVELVEGELPRNLDPSIFRDIDTLIHVAASSRFEMNPVGEPIRTNLDGTQALLQAAAQADIHHLVFTSTAYVCGRRTGRIRERMESQEPEFHNVYERSKWNAEQRVARWASDGRVATICRPGIFFGDRDTGRTTNFNGIYIIARATEILRRAADDNPALDRHHIPLRIPGDPDATTNLVPVDWVAGQMTDILLDPQRHGHVHHLTNPHPPTHREIKQWLEEHFDIAGGIFCDDARPLETPNPYEALFYSLGNAVRDYFRSGLCFDSRTLSTKNDSPTLVTRNDFLRSLRFAQARQWGRFPRNLSVPAPSNNANEIDPRWYFEEFLPQRLPGSSVARIDSLTTTVRFQVGADDTGWLCRFEQGRLISVKHGRNGVIEDFAYRVSHEAFTKIVNAEEPIQAAFFRRDAMISGNMEHALRLVPVMSRFIKECPVENVRNG